MSYATGKNILVTGGTGSIGSTLVNKLIEENPNRIRILDNDENRLYELKSKFVGHGIDIEIELINIRERDEVRIATKNIDIVYHTAALKHVGLIERNPFAGVETNIFGTRNVIRAAIDENVDSVIVVSTDKASNPVSTMGATKLLAERLTVAANSSLSGHNTKLSCVRFGNVIGTRGSVIPVFLNQLQNGNPLTVTDSSMTRFAMVPDEAARFMIESSEISNGGEIFVKKMQAFELGDLVEAVIDGFADRLSPNPGDTEIDYIGAKPGERYHEKLISNDERRFTQELDDKFVVVPNYESETNQYDTLENSLDGEYTSKNAKRLSKERLIDMIENYGVEDLL